MILFIVTSANVIASDDDYAAFGGKDVKAGNKALRSFFGIGAGDDADLSLSQATWGKITKVDWNQFSQKTPKSLARAVSDIYAKLEEASQCGRGEEARVCMLEWFSRNDAAKIRLNMRNVSTYDTFASDNKGAIEDFMRNATLKALETSNTAIYLTQLNGTPGAKRATKVGEYRTAQEAYDAYDAAKTAGNLDAMKDVLAKADVLRVGAKDRDLRSLAEKERAKVGIDEVRAAKQRALAKHSGGALKPEDEVALHFYTKAVELADDGIFSSLGFEDASAFSLNLSGISKFLSSVSESIGLNVSLSDQIKILEKERDQLKLQQSKPSSAAGAGGGAGAASGSSGGAGKPGAAGGDNPDGQPLFDIPPI